MSGNDTLVRPLDHVVVAVRDADVAGATYERLGFQVVPLMRHLELGCCNRVIQLQGSYIELLGDIDRSVPALRERLEPRLACGEGIVLSSLRSQDLESDRLKLLQSGARAGRYFSARRKVPMPDGSEVETDSRALYPWNAPPAVRYGVLHRASQARGDLDPGVSVTSKLGGGHRQADLCHRRSQYRMRTTSCDCRAWRRDGSLPSRRASWQARRNLEFLSRAAALQRFAAVDVPACDSQPVLGMALEVRAADLDSLCARWPSNGVNFERQGRADAGASDPGMRGCCSTSLT